MLALTRKVGEKIIIGENIVLTVVDVKGDSVKLGIEAPRDVKIYRGEIFDAIAAENKQAANLAGTDELKQILKITKDFANSTDINNRKTD